MRTAVVSGPSTHTVSFALNQEASGEVARREVVVAGDGDERPAEQVRHVLDEACLAAARRALEHDGKPLLVAGVEELDLVAEGEVVGRLGAVGESEGLIYVYKYRGRVRRKIGPVIRRLAALARDDTGLAALAQCRCDRRVDHRPLRVARESTLQEASERVGKADERVSRPRQCVEVIPDAVVRRVPLDGESLLADLAMGGQRAVGESDTTQSALCVVLIDVVDDATGIDRPESEVTNENSDIGARRGGCAGGMDAGPTE